MRKLVVSLVSKLVYRKDVREDVTQEVCVKLLKMKKKPRNLKAWLWKTILNTSKDLHRKEKKSRGGDGERLKKVILPEHVQYSPLEFDTTNAIMSLPDKDRDIALRYFIDGYMIERISLDYPSRHFVQSSINRSRKVLREELHEYATPATH